MPTLSGGARDTSIRTGKDDMYPLVVVSTNRLVNRGGLSSDLAHTQCCSQSLVGGRLWHVLDHRRLGESILTSFCYTARCPTRVRDPTNVAGSDAACPRVSLRGKLARTRSRIG